jgi:hypothetical protein
MLSKVYIYIYIYLLYESKSTTILAIYMHIYIYMYTQIHSHKFPQRSLSLRPCFQRLLYDDDDVYLRLQHGKGFHNFVYMSYVKHINPAKRHK